MFGVQGYQLLVIYRDSKASSQWGKGQGAGDDCRVGKLGQESRVIRTAPIMRDGGEKVVHAYRDICGIEMQYKGVRYRFCEVTL